MRKLHFSAIFLIIFNAPLFSQEGYTRLKSKGISLEANSNVERFGLDYTVDGLNPDTEDSLELHNIPLNAYESLRLEKDDKIIWCDQINRNVTLFSVTKTLENIRNSNIRVSRIEGAKEETHILN